MTTKPVNNPEINQKALDADNQKQHQDRERAERKHSGQSGSAAGRNNHSPRKGDKGEQHADAKKTGR